MVQKRYTSKTMVILDFKREAQQLRNIIDRFSLPSACVLRPAVLYAFSNLFKKRTGAMLTTFYFAACDFTDELLIPRLDSGGKNEWVYHLSDVEVEKQKQEFFILVQMLGSLIERHLEINSISVPDKPEDVLATTLRGDSLYVIYNQRLEAGYEDERDFRSRSV